ncbi:ankyrin-1-like [Pomacea canaliculata]|uniref:ankyrin-1-like n=1 Tax=Pomacea canaliculata TaxID=400727 RepID=UPI000D73A253|nr:ankyrin-1-like [Pomacea canaliculata]
MSENIDSVSGPTDTPVNLDIRDSEGFTLLMRASQPSAEGECVNSNGDTLSVINHLLDSGVDTEARSPDGLTAFEMAVQCNYWPAILALLPRCEVKIGDNVLLEGQLYLHELAKQKDICEEKLRSFTKTLLAHGLNINELDSHGHSPLILAAKHKNWNYVVVLLQHGAEANVNVNSQNLLHLIIANQREIPHSMLTALLDAMQARGVDFNRQDYEGRPILFKYEVYSSISSGQDPSGSFLGC